MTMQIGMTKQMEWQTKWNGKQSGMANKVEWQTKWNDERGGMPRARGMTEQER
jgi:hypothetical protein